MSIQAKPTWIPLGKAKQALCDIAELFRGGASDDAEKRSINLIKEHIAARLACHASVRSGDSLTRDEVYALFSDMDKAESAGVCPHGRPVVKYFSKNEVEHFFGRP